MQADALELAAHAVQPKAVIVARNSAEPKGVASRIDRLSANRDRGLQGVEIRRLGAPRPCALHLEGRRPFRDAAAFRVEDPEANVRDEVAGVAQLDCRRNGFEAWRQDRQPVRHDADSSAPPQAHRPVDAGAGVPARTLRKVLCLDGYQAGMRKLDLERGIAVFPASYAFAVQKHLWARHDAVKLEFRPFGAFWKVNPAAVLPFADPRQGACSPRLFRRLRLSVLDDRYDLYVASPVEWPCSRPVVRHRHGAPGIAGAAKLPAPGKLLHAESSLRRRAAFIPASQQSGRHASRTSCHGRRKNCSAQSSHFPYFL